MDPDFQKLMSGKSDESLQEYLDHRSKYTPAAIAAAIAELQKRGKVISEDELTTISQEFQVRKEVAEKKGRSNKWNRMKRNVVTDRNAPEYFSEQGVYLLSGLFGVVFGTVLLGMNMRQTKYKEAIWEVVVFGIIYTGLQVWVFSLLPATTGLALFSSLAGGALMNQLFWKKYIGKETKYRARPLLIPFLIGIVITVPLLILAVRNGAVR